MRLIREHWVALVFAIAFGLALAGPFLLVATDSAFNGVYPELANDQNFYLSRIQDVRDGFPASGNTYIAEDKAVPPMNFLTGEIVQAKILDLLNLPTHAGLFLFSFLWGSVIFILTYAVLISLGAPRFWALIGTLGLLGSYFFAFARPISPQFNFIFWLLSVLALVRMNQTWVWVGMVSVSAGVLFYLYPYYWTHIFATYGLLFFWYLIHERKTALKIFIAGIGAVIVGIPYILHGLSLRVLPDYEESLKRLGFIETHFPSGIAMTVGSVILLAAILFLSRKLKTTNTQLTATFALLFGALVAMNQHVLTGINMEFSSHYSMQITFGTIFLGFAAMNAFGFWPQLLGNSRRVVAVVLVLFISIPSISFGYLNAMSQLKESAKYTEQGLLIEWLNDNAKPQEAVYAEERLSIVIPGYTQQDVFYARNANIAFMPDAEVIDRFIIQNFRTPLTPEFLSQHEREFLGHGSINANSHALQKQKILGLFGITVDVPKRVADDSVTQVLARAEELRSVPFEESIKGYRADYFIIGKNEQYPLTAEDLTFTEPVFETENYTVYAKKK